MTSEAKGSSAGSPRQVRWRRISSSAPWSCAGGPAGSPGSSGTPTGAHWASWRARNTRRHATKGAPGWRRSSAPKAASARSNAPTASNALARSCKAPRCSGFTRNASEASRPALACSPSARQASARPNKASAWRGCKRSTRSNACNARAESCTRCKAWPRLNHAPASFGFSRKTSPSARIASPGRRRASATAAFTGNNAPARGLNNSSSTSARSTPSMSPFCNISSV